MEAQPLPAYLPKLRERLVYHEYHTATMPKPSLGRPAFRTTAFAESNHVLDKHDSNTELPKPTRERDGYETDDDVVAAAGPGKLDGTSVGIELEELTLDVLLVRSRYPSSKKLKLKPLNPTGRAIACSCDWFAFFFFG